MRRFAFALALAAIVAAAGIIGIASATTDRGRAQITLQVMGWKGSQIEPANIPQINQAFEAAHPDIQVNWTFAPGDATYVSNLNTRFAGGNAPDVVMVDAYKMRAWAPQGFLADLGDQPWVSKQYPSLKPLHTVAGKTYQLIQENIGVGLYVNLDLLKNAGIKGSPQNWPQFISDLKILKAKGMNGLLLPNKGGWDGNNLSSMLAANTVYKKTPNWGALFNAGKRHFNPDYAPVVDKMRQLFTLKLVDSRLMLGLDPWSDGTSLFKTGEWAFSIQGAWMMSDFTKNAHFHFAFMPFPGGGAGTSPRSFTFVGTGLAVNAKSPNLAAAKEYLRFWSTPQALGLYDSAENAFSTVKGVTPKLASEIAPFAKAYASGRTIIAPAQGWTNPDAETGLSTVFQMLFANPKTKTTTILKALDKAIYQPS